MVFAAPRESESGPLRRSLNVRSSVANGRTADVDWAPAPNGSAAFDPSATLSLPTEALHKARLSPFQSGRFNRYDAVP
jgi:hypothetical protein